MTRTVIEVDVGVLGWFSGTTPREIEVEHEDGRVEEVWLNGVNITGALGRGDICRIEDELRCASNT